MFDPSRPDFTARISFLSVGEGGRGPVMTGYRPNHRFGERQELNDALHTYDRAGWVQPGETVDGSLSLLSAERLAGELYVGMPFTIQEGSKIVGGGVITQILNPVVACPPDPGREAGG